MVLSNIEDDSPQINIITVRINPTSSQSPIRERSINSWIDDIKLSLRTSGIDPVGADNIISSLRQSTQKQYGTYIYISF